MGYSEQVEFTLTGGKLALSTTATQQNATGIRLASINVPMS